MNSIGVKSRIKGMKSQRFHLFILPSLCSFTVLLLFAAFWGEGEMSAVPVVFLWAGWWLAWIAGDGGQNVRIVLACFGTLLTSVFVGYVQDTLCVPKWDRCPLSGATIGGSNVRPYFRRSDLSWSWCIRRVPGFVLDCRRLLGGPRMAGFSLAAQLASVRNPRSSPCAGMCFFGVPMVPL